MIFLGYDQTQKGWGLTYQGTYSTSYPTQPYITYQHCVEPSLLKLLREKEEMVQLDFVDDNHYYHNLSFGLATKARACKGAGQKKSPVVASHAPGNVGECEGMNPHIPKGVPTLGVKVLVDFRILKERL
jgi:hypothetical protein